MPFQKYQIGFVLSLGLLVLWTSCGDEDLENAGHTEYTFVHYPDAYYPRVDRIATALGNGYVDVTIHGAVQAPTDSITTVHTTILDLLGEVILLPIAQPGTASGGEIETPFQKTVRISLDPRPIAYEIAVIGQEVRTGGRGVLTQKIYGMDGSDKRANPLVVRTSCLSGSYNSFPPTYPRCRRSGRSHLTP